MSTKWEPALEQVIDALARRDLTNEMVAQAVVELKRLRDIRNGAVVLENNIARTLEEVNLGGEGIKNHSHRTIATSIARHAVETDLLHFTVRVNSDRSEQITTGRLIVLPPRLANDLKPPGRCRV